MSTIGNKPVDKIISESDIDPELLADLGAKAEGCLYENSRTINVSYTLTAGKSAMCVGPLSISNGATLTIPSGERLLVF